MTDVEQNFYKIKVFLKALINTKGTTIVEASPVDCIWGIGLSENDPRAKNRHTWRGKNLLGEVLTNLRNDLINEGHGNN